MKANGYLVVNSEKTIFMKHKGKHFIIHGLLVDDVMHIAVSDFTLMSLLTAPAAAFDCLLKRLCR
jgi:hypothetical protein